MCFEQFGSHGVVVEAKYKFIAVHLVTECSIRAQAPSLPNSHFPCLYRFGQCLVKTPKLKSVSQKRAASRSCVVEAKFLHPNPRFGSVIIRDLRFYRVSYYLKGFIWHGRPKCGDFKLWFLVIIGWHCLWVFGQVTKVRLSAVIIEPDFEVLKIFGNVSGQVEFWALEVRCHEFVYPT